MRIATACLLLAATLSVVVWLALRQRTLTELRATNLSLRQQLEAAPAAAPPAPPPAAPTTNAVADLTPEEESELLRLRGQIQPLRRELASLSNRLSGALPPKARAARGVPAVPAPAQQAHFQAVHAYMQSENQRGVHALGQALANYLAQNGNQLPEDLAKLQTTIAPVLASDLVQSFELMRSGQVSITEQSYTLVARAKEPQQLSDGNLGRAYLRADGTLLYGSLQAPADWPAWERQTQERAQRQQGLR